MPKSYSISHFVVMVDNATGKVYFDPDGSREWIRLLFDEPTNTYDTEEGVFVPFAPYVEENALNILEQHGIIFEEPNYDWRTR